MPELIRCCYLQLKANNNNVLLVSKDNIDEYVHLPDYIFEKVQQGKISFTHLSDILRVSLLAEYGGFWIDSTCWVTESLPKEVYGMTLISPRTKGLPDLPIWSNSRWCSWAIGTNIKGNPLFTFTRDVFYAIVLKTECWPFYLFMDYLYDYAYRNIPEVKTMIDAIPENNVRRNELHFMLNKSYNEYDYKNLISSNWIFKLSYKTPWKEKTADGKITFYGMLLNKNSND